MHSNGKYEKCNRCNFVGTAFVVKKHQERDHKDSGANPDGGGAGSCVCETCGKVLNDSKALYMHMLIHKTYKCKQCGAEVVGYSAFQTHKKNAHPVGQPESYPCEVNVLLGDKSLIREDHPCYFGLMPTFRCVVRLSQPR